MFATFDEFRLRYGDTRTVHLTVPWAKGNNPVPAVDAPARRDAIERALQEATDTITGYADVPDPVPQIVKRWCLVLAMGNLAQGSGDGATYTDLDQSTYDEVMKALERAKDGDMPWETKADQDIPSGPGPSVPLIIAVTPLSSCREYGFHNVRRIS